MIGRDRCVHALAERGDRERFERVRPRLVDAARGRNDLLTRYPELRVRNESGPQAKGRSYVGWEWRDVSRDGEDADMAVELVVALQQAWDQVLGEDGSKA